jgi:hypothetical protein
MMLEWYCTATSGYACHFNSLCFQPAGGQSLFSSCRTDEARRGTAAVVGILKSDPQS